MLVMRVNYRYVIHLHVRSSREAHHKLSCGFDENHSVLFSVYVLREVCSRVISVDEPRENLCHQWEVGCSKIVH